MNKEEEEIIRYLLGQLDATDVTRIEERYFEDANYFELLQAVEASLIDDYLEGQLSEIQKEAFVKNFLRSPRRKAQVVFTQALRRKAEEENKTKKNSLPEPSPRSWLDVFRLKNFPIFVPLSVALLIVSAITLWVIQNQISASKQSQVAVKSDTEGKQAAGNQAATREATPQANTNPNNPPPSVELNKPEPNIKKSLASITLDPNSQITRGKARIQRVEVTSETEELNIKLIFNSDDYKSYSIVVKDKAARNIANRENLKAQANRLGKQLSVKFPARTFDDEEYFITIMGVSESGTADEIVEYAFRVVKK